MNTKTYVIIALIGVVVLLSIPITTNTSMFFIPASADPNPHDIATADTILNVPGCLETEIGCYTPNPLTVEVGHTVTMQNSEDTEFHTYTSGVETPDGIFDSDTNTPNGMGRQSKAMIDTMFTFSESLGSVYRGIWESPDTFVITIKGIKNSGIMIDTTTVTPSEYTQILSIDGTSTPSNSTSPVLSGDFVI